MMKHRVGKYVFGLGGILYGAVTLAWQQVDALGNLAHPTMVVLIIGIAEIAGGLAILWNKTERVGAMTLAAVFFIFSAYWILQIVGLPLEFYPWGNFGEQFSIVLGGVFVFASTLRADLERKAIIERSAYIAFGICVVSYALYQLFYLTYTASLVPKWIPPGQMFWAVATSVLFALAAFGLLSGRLALLASRLLTLMLVLFGFLVWFPPALADLHKMSNWQEFASNLIMTGTSWIVADLLSKRESDLP